MRACLSPIRCGWLFLGVAMLIGLASVSWTQDQLGTKKDLEAAWVQTTKDRNRFMFAGESPTAAEKKNTEKVADAAAKWFLFRITHKTYDPYKVVHTEFATAVNNQKCTREFLNYFGPALVTNMKTVLERDTGKDRSTVVQAAMMLPIMAKIKHESVGDYLADMVKDPKTPDAVRLYALKALKETMPVVVQPDDLTIDLKDKDQNARRIRDAKQVGALAKFIEEPVKVDGMKPEEIAAVRYFRREAIVSLSQAGAPAVLALKKPMTLEGPVAPTLLKVLAEDVQPPPSLHEKIEAALGLCAMKHPNMPEYNPEIAAYLIGKTLQEYVAVYNKDWVNFAAVGAGKKLPLHAYKVDARRFEAGLADFAKSANIDAANKLMTYTQPILKNMMTYNQPPDGTLNDFRLYLQKRPAPKTGKVFNNVKGPEIVLDGK